MSIFKNPATGPKQLEEVIFERLKLIDARTVNVEMFRNHLVKELFKNDILSEEEEFFSKVKNGVEESVFVSFDNNKYLKKQEEERNSWAQSIENRIHSKLGLMSLNSRSSTGVSGAARQNVIQQQAQKIIADSKAASQLTICPPIDSSTSTANWNSYDWNSPRSQALPKGHPHEHIWPNNVAKKDKDSEEAKTSGQDSTKLSTRLDKKVGIEILASIFSSKAPLPLL